jgi:hypothetical protein
MVLVNNPPISTKRTVTSHLKKDQDIWPWESRSWIGTGILIIFLNFFLYKKNSTVIKWFPSPHPPVKFFMLNMLSCDLSLTYQVNFFFFFILYLFWISVEIYILYMFSAMATEAFHCDSHKQSINKRLPF